ncbi:BAG family molecular chaperone regulator 4 [Myripristis murdjan]|uniref:BCL2 associated athanogene 4 n=1 Tax=Myripristis murdjan TaxID=586833 RepID=A0A667WZL1_9TELE|nr:BAG family molecular chaperone regulator 4 [Myripristis murdjan]
MHHHQMQPNPKSGWPSTYNSENNNVNWNGTMDAPQYPGYPSNYWYPQSHSTGHYASTYPSGSDVQPPYNPQAMPGAYPNGHGVYSPGQGQYSTSNFHPSNPFYCPDPQRPAPCSYPSQGCPAEQSSGGSGQPHSHHQHQHHQYPGPHCQGTPGYPPASYPHYSEGGHAMPPNPPYPTGQSLHPRPQADAWAHSGGYPSSQQQWQPGQQPPQNHYGNPVRPQHPPAWPGTGTGAPPPYQPKDQQHQRAPQVGPKPRPAPSPNPPNGKPADFSSPPHMYNRTGKGGPTEHNSQGEPPPFAQAPAQAPAPAPAPAPGQTQGLAGPQTFSDNPGLAKVQQVMTRVLLLQEDVDEFVGKKTDKSYRCLEELLTKELLELDSVETQGQDNVRQARKEAVQRIQAILDQLEKKAF